MTGCLINLKTWNFGFLIFVQKSLIKMTLKTSCKNATYYCTVKIKLFILLASHIGRYNTH